MLTHLSRVEFYSSGQLKKGALAKSTVVIINGREVNIGDEIMSSYLDTISFYENGQIEKAMLYDKNPQKFSVGNLVFSLTGDHVYGHTLFYEDGQIKEGWLAKEITFLIDGHRIVYPQFSKIMFDEKGHLVPFQSSDIKVIESTSSG